MRYISTFLFFCSLLLHAEERPTCYTVQHLSFPTSSRQSIAIDINHYPPNCRLMETGNLTALRCGCYNSFKESNRLLASMREQYPNAIIVETYRDNFDTTAVKTEKHPVATKKKNASAPYDEEQSRIMYQVFIYATNLKDAYKTAQVALSHNPDSLFWHQKMAEVSRWLGKTKESMKHYLFVYRHTHDKKLENELITYMVAAYQFKQAAPLIRKRAIRNPSKQNIKDLIFIYHQLGTPEEAAEILSRLYRKDPSKTEYLTEILRIYLDVGDLSRARSVIDQIESLNIQEIDTASLLAYYYFLQREMEASYAALTSVYAVADNNATQYHKQVSDLGWHMQDFTTSASSALTLKEQGGARLVDYDRILYVYRQSRPEVARSAALEAYEIFHLPYLFFSYAYSALEHNKHTSLQKTVDKIEREGQDKELKENGFYWLIKAEIYQYFHQNIKAEEALRRALMLVPDDTQIQTELLWFLIDNRYDKALKKMLFDIEDRFNVDPQLWLPLAVAHSHLQESDRALKYVLKLKRAGNENVELKFLYADILKTQNEDEPFMKQISEIMQMLERQKEQEPLIAMNSYPPQRDVLDMEDLLDRKEESLFGQDERTVDNRDGRAMINSAKSKLPSDLAKTMRGFAMVESFQTEKMVQYLSQQHPQITAVILLMIDAKKAETILEYFETAQRDDVFASMKDTEAVSQEALQVLDEALQRELLALQKEQEPAVMDDAAFLNDYLNAALHTMGPDQFEHTLADSKAVLDERHYNDIAFAWSLRNNAYEQARLTMEHLNSTEPWKRLALALHFGDSTGIQNSLCRDHMTLPARDSVYAAAAYGQIALARELAFEGLENNSHDDALYLQVRNLHEEHADKLNFQSGYRNREILQQLYFNAQNSFYVARGINFLTDFNIDDNKIIDSTELSIVPYYDIEMQLGLRKRFDLGYLQIKVGVRDAMKRYGTASLSAAAQINSHVALEIKAEKNAKADETLHLILGGKKDDIALQTTLQWFPSSQLTLSVEKSYFSSQDEIELGDGVRGRIDAQTTLYTAYPDFGGEIFCEFGVYDELKGKKGVIDIIDPEVDKVLPEDFWNIGATLYYGVDNSTRYARLWQPFFEFTSYYTDPTEQINIALNAGYGRSLSNGDTLTAGIDYVQAVNGTQETTIELFLRYRWLY